MHKTTNRFWKIFENLPINIQNVARENFDLLKINPRLPSLQFKKVGKLWSARISLNYRALAVEDEEDFIWIWIGTHDEYLRMIR